MRIILSVLGLLPILVPVSAAATAAPKGREVRCVVEGNGLPAYRGRCLFLSGESGSFGLEPRSARTFPGGITSISLTVLSRGEGDVRGLTSDGINSRWGRASRDRRDRACWRGSDFRICAY